MAFLTYLFYAASVVFVIFEIHVLFLRLAKPYYKADKMMIFLAVAYFIWSVFGLFSSQWMMFAAMLMVGHTTKAIKNYNASDGKKDPAKTPLMRTVYVLDALISIALLISVMSHISIYHQ